MFLRAMSEYHFELTRSGIRGSKTRSSSLGPFHHAHIRYVTVSPLSMLESPIARNCRGFCHACSTFLEHVVIANTLNDEHYSPRSLRSIVHIFRKHTAFL